MHYYDANYSRNDFFVKQYVIFLIAYAIFSFFQTPIMPLTDAMTLESRIPFGAIRKWGAIGFGSGSVSCGAIGRRNRTDHHISHMRVGIYHCMDYGSP